LYCSLVSSERLGELPEDVRDYLSFLHARNRERNLRLHHQLLEAISALNGVGIRPVLLKGAAGLFTSPDAKIGSRLMSDIDMGVEPYEFEAARSCFFKLGYEDVDGDRGMGRPGDAAMLELRPHVFEPAVLTDGPPSLHPRHIASGTARAWIPSPTSQALHMIRHDMLKEGDYWRGRIDLRHLHDLAQLADTDEGVDWKCLRDTMPRNPERNALETQLLTLKELFGIEIPPMESYRPMALLQSWRRMMVAMHPVAGRPLRLAGNLVWGWKRMLAADCLRGRGVSYFALRASRILTETSTGPKV
jgi:hypothetical protein